MKRRDSRQIQRLGQGGTLGGFVIDGHVFVLHGSGDVAHDRKECGCKCNARLIAVCGVAPATKAKP